MESPCHILPLPFILVNLVQMDNIVSTNFSIKVLYFNDLIFTRFLGRVVPAEFVGFCKSQTPVDLPQEEVTNHDELMSNFFSQVKKQKIYFVLSFQPDALACGKTIEELKAENVPEDLQGHKFFPGNRPSSQFLIDELSPFSVGQILAIYEHRTAVEGFLWGINSFDQWGVELGKALAKQVRKFLHENRSQTDNPKCEQYKFNSSTMSLLKRYCAKKE